MERRTLGRKHVTLMKVERRIGQKKIRGHDRKKLKVERKNLRRKGEIQIKNW